MKEYVRPMMDSEVFMANEYIAVCWGVACNTGLANKYEQSIWNFSAVHRSNHCGNVNNQYLVDNNNDNVADAMYEINSNYGTLNCKFYTDNTYQHEINISDINLSSGQSIYWTTEGILITYHHQGAIQGYDENHSNRS